MKSAIFLTLLIISLGTAAEPRLRPDNWGHPLVGTTLRNSYQVDTGVYRAAQPDDSDIADLRALGISEVLNLREFHSDDHELNATTIQLHRVAMEASSVSEEQIIAALKVIKERHGPILIHCWHGSDRTGITVAAYRLVFNGWSKAQALDEMVNGGYGYHGGVYPNLVQRIEGLDIGKIRRALGVAEVAQKRLDEKDR